MLMQPGQSIAPDGNNREEPPKQESAVQDVPASNIPAPVPAPITQTPLVSNAIKDTRGSISWTASEFIEHTKPSGWYVAVMLGGVLISGVLYLLTRDLISVVVVIMATAMFLVAGSRKPDTKQFEISYEGIKAGPKSFGFDYFKSFSMIEEGAIDSIQLMPLKNLEMPIRIYFPPSMHDQITGFLADYLPHEEKSRDLVDRLMRKLKF
jgi:hypothetical protein